MSDARALVAALARFAARRPRPPHSKIAMSIALAALAALAVAAPASAEPDGDPLPAAPSTDLPATPETFTVKIGNEDGDFCTGFYVGRKMVAMAGHCVSRTLVTEAFTGPIEKRTLIALYTVTLDTGDKLQGDLVGFGDPSFDSDDWALVRLRAPLPTGWEPATLDCSGAELKAGTRVYADGYPAWMKGELNHMEGFVSGRTKSLPGDKWKHPTTPLTMPVAPGASGSAVRLEDGGAVVGIVVAMHATQTAWSYAQPIKPICDALGR